MTQVSHSLLVEKAAGWLRNRGALLVLKEPRSGVLNVNAEIPDAIGWSAGHGAGTTYLTTVIECKTAADDLRRNSEKKAMLGNIRYFLVTEEVARLVENTGMPEGWGLLVYNGRIIKTLIQPVPSTEKDTAGEYDILVHTLRAAVKFQKIIRI